MFATKKITPGGHWIGITAIAARQAQSTFIETVDAFTHVSVALLTALFLVGMKSGIPWWYARNLDQPVL